MRLSPRSFLAALACAGLVATGATFTAPQARAEETGPGLGDEASLAAALKRDLGITLEQFRAAGALGEVAERIQAEMAGKPGLQRFAVQNGKLVVIGSGPELAAVAKSYGVTVDTASAALTATSLGDIVKQYVEQVGTDGLQYIGTDVNGYVIKVNEPTAVAKTTAQNKGQAKKSAVEFAKQFKNVKVEKSTGKMEKTATVYNGQGTYSNGTICSLGFAAWDAAGAPFAVTAGHCSTGTGQQVYARSTTGEPAMGQSGATNIGLIGTYAAAEFGTTSETAPGTDLATINANGGQTLMPYVLKWQSSGVAGNATANPVPVTGQAAPVIGNPVCRSGRTSGWRCSTISYIGAAAVDGGNGTVRFVNGFASNGLYAAGGDSGGSMITGYKALGVTSAVGKNADGSWITTAASLGDMGRVQAGVTVKTYIPGPQVIGSTSTGSTTFETSAFAGQMKAKVPVLSGDTLAPGTQVIVTLDGANVGTFPVAADGTFTFNYTGGNGVHTLTMQAKNGFSLGIKTTTTVRTVPAQGSGVLGDQDADGVADLMMVGTDGVLYYCRNKGDGTLADPIPVGSGWGYFRWVSNIKDMNGDGWSEVLAVAWNGELGVYMGNGPGRLQPITWVGSGWGALDLFTIVDDVDGNGQQEIMARYIGNGDMLRFPIQSQIPLTTSGAHLAAPGWGSVLQSFTVGDFRGGTIGLDGIPDMLVTVSGGGLYLEGFNRDGKIDKIANIGSGWGVFKSIGSPGDATGDGLRDLYALNQQGTVYIFRNQWQSQLVPQDVYNGMTNISYIY